MMLVTGGRDSFGIHSLEYYRRAYDLFYPAGMCELLVAEYEGKPLAARWSSPVEAAPGISHGRIAQMKNGIVCRNVSTSIGSHKMG